MPYQTAEMGDDLDEKFAVIELYRNFTDIPIKSKLVRKMPKALKELYILAKSPCVAKGFVLQGAAGMTFTLPLAKSDLGNLERTEKICQKSLKQLKLQNVVAISPAKELSGFDWGILTVDERYIFSFFVIDAIKRILKKQKKDLKHAKLLIIHGADKITDVFIHNIYPFVNNLTIFAENPDSSLHSLADFAYQDSGLHIEIVGSFSSFFVGEADIVLDFTNDEEISRHTAAAVYINMSGQDKARESEVLQGKINYSQNRKFISRSHLSMAFYISKREFRRIVDNDYKAKDFYEFRLHLKNSAIALI